MNYETVRRTIRTHEWKNGTLFLDEHTTGQYAVCQDEKVKRWFDSLPEAEAYFNELIPNQPQTEESNGQHTPGPYITKGAFVKFDETGQGADVIGWNAKANAAFIVKACNSHYELLNALKDLFEWSCYVNTGDAGNQAQQRAEAAIKNAEQ